MNIKRMFGPTARRLLNQPLERPIRILSRIEEYRHHHAVAAPVRGHVKELDLGVCPRALDNVFRRRVKVHVVQIISLVSEDDLWTIAHLHQQANVDSRLLFRHRGRSHLFCPLVRRPRHRRQLSAQSFTLLNAYRRLRLTRSTQLVCATQLSPMGRPERSVPILPHCSRFCSRLVDRSWLRGGRRLRGVALGSIPVGRALR
mmetsp:Transcript_4945/g.11537  ORF Transcript_4945/g.11537 Transcript_4945/m.11537 type:complete len:201 (+) Transcript_4945:519-1121(+)